MQNASIGYTAVPLVSPAPKASNYHQQTMYVNTTNTYHPNDPNIVRSSNAVILIRGTI
jgi:hypothetical protein